MKGDVVQLHIPKTGGSALRHALRGSGAERWGHSFALKPVAPGRRYLVTLRDPVARFESAFAFSRSRLAHRGYETADELARSLAGSFSRIRDLVVFRPQVEWATVERLREPDILWVGQTETLDADFERLRSLLDISGDLPPLGHPRRNAQRYEPQLSAKGAAHVRGWYAADYELLRGLD